MPSALRSLLKRAYLGRIQRLLKEGQSVYQARQAAAVFLPKRRLQAERCDTHPPTAERPES
jgi:hypothetical protein